ncbi:hypothetical protein SLNWT_6507 [Streptomyces albus]|uniref:Uncharacterized protein n=1 Tax=Streptomyces albus (strain ATCC 21838 / DSM 41398 / FERM P-419 / JCM 4703 / NBRC 107858) TaxID=1081613 RepID=A0A0B5EVQ7_STRA4|nr:hypothetical protein SLNWT_6507 [Streptomyces albus]AOU81187.1 hypothetical protein SLNHY_6496 [Streptomyces albus]
MVPFRITNTAVTSDCGALSMPDRPRAAQGGWPVVAGSIPGAARDGEDAL